MPEMQANVNNTAIHTDMVIAVGIKAHNHVGVDNYLDNINQHSGYTSTHCVLIKHL